MNNSRIWLVVKPTVGLPILLGAVAVSSFAVHLAVLSKVTWYEDYLAGKELGSGAASAALESTTNIARAEETVPGASFEPAAAGGQRVMVTMPDGSVAEAILTEPALVAASGTRTATALE